MADISKLKRSRNIAKRSLAKLAAWEPSGRTIEELEVRLSKLEDTYAEFQTSQTAIEDELGDGDILAAEEELRDGQEDLYFKIKAALLQERNKLTSGTKETASGNVTELMESLTQEHARLSGLLDKLSLVEARSSTTAAVKLPTINIPKFSGKYEDWISFHDMFQNLVDENPILSPVQQMHYLKDALVGEAASTIRHMAITESNYKAAWAQLKARYHKAKYITEAHLKRMIDYPAITKPTAAEIRQLVNTFEEATRALEALGHKTEQWDCWLVYIASHKLDSTSRQLWARHSAAEEMPTFKSFIACLEERQHELQSYSGNVEGQRAARETTSRTVAAVTSPTHQHECYQCGGQHPLFKCPEFIDLNEAQRKTVALQADVCFNCLVAGHTAIKCKSIRCKACQGLHHTLLHAARGSLTRERMASTLSSGNRAEHKHYLRAEQKHQLKANHIYILPTATAYTQHQHGHRLPCRMLLDSAAEVTLVTKAFMNTLRITWTSLQVPISGVGGTSNLTTLGTTTLSLTSRYGVRHLTVTALVVRRIMCHVPKRSLDLRKMDISPTLELADREFHKPAPIDLLLGAEPTLQLFHNRRAIRAEQYTALNTVFGWVITGVLDANTGQSITTVAATTTEAEHENKHVDSLLRKFWEIESIENYPVLTPEEIDCEEQYNDMCKRTQNGRYMVQLPFRQQYQPLGDSRKRAVQRLQKLEARFTSDAQLIVDYNKFMNEYIQLGHMSPLTSQDRKLNAEQQYYIPHHAVLKPSSKKTKLRVVFDASAKSTTGVSLNDKLLVGPTIQKDIFTLLCEFRKFSIAMTADITKMYRQVLVDNASANYQRIVWRFSKEEPITDYKLNTVTYGTASAPFQAIRTLHQIINDGHATSERAAAAIKNNFYVDDYLGGADNISDAVQLKEELINTLSSSGMELRGWVSNSPLIADNDNNPAVQQDYIFESNELSSVLGLRWSPTSDTFTFNINISPPSSITKRTFLATTARVFDPLGFLAPITIVARIQLQQLWTSGIGWDDPVPDTVAQMLVKQTQQLEHLTNLKIRRYIGKPTSTTELYGFADASQSAYAAVVYIKTRMNDGSGNHEVSLIAARTKVAPIKQVTIPRLELCAAELLTKLIRKVASGLGVDLNNCHCFTDSQVTLAWISDNPRRWKTFVANRTSNIIQIIPPERWHHINTKHNPADCASRGMDPLQLIHHRIWWEGPQIMQTKLCTLRRPVLTQEDDILAEARTIPVNVLTVETSFPVSNYSSWRKLLRITATCLRFIHNARSNLRHKRTSGPLSNDELQIAFTALIKQSQAESFGMEIQSINDTSVIPRSCQLRALDPFIDQEGVMRVNGRLENADLPYNQRHPIILHRKHHITQLIVEDKHREHLHAAHKLLRTLILDRFWIIGAQVLIKQTIRNCVTCIRHRAKPIRQKMAPFPTVRVTPARAFANCGVDYAGPIIVKSWTGRSAKRYKAYIALFVCLSTKAIHIETVSNLTTEGFIVALRRFIARRGPPDNIYSDNGTNFVGANKEISQLYKMLKTRETAGGITNFNTSKGIQWHFIPPAAPHFGGIWEAGVKAAKYHLARVIGNAVLTFEELSTLLCQIEHCLNSRPLCPLSGDINDISALTPNHFLIGLSGGMLPDNEIRTTHPNYLQRWKYIQKLHSDTWTRWKNEYLRLIQQRSKWTRLTDNIIVGSLVVVKDDHSPPAVWPLARIIRVHPGKDNLVRVVTIRTQYGEFKRPVSKLVLLPNNNTRR